MCADSTSQRARAVSSRELLLPRSFAEPALAQQSGVKAMSLRQHSGQGQRVREASPPGVAPAAAASTWGHASLDVGSSTEHTTRLLDLTMAACCCAAQAWAWQASAAAPATTSGSALASAPVQAALLAVQAATLAFLLLAGRRSWRRRRAWAIAAMRLASVANLPLLQQMKVRAC